MANENTEKLFSVQDVIELVAEANGTQPKDLIEQINEKDLSTKESLSSFIKPFTVAYKNAAKDTAKSKFDEGFRKGKQKIEKEFLEVFQIDDSDGKTGADLFMTVKQSIAKAPEPKDKSITASQAFNVKEVKDKIAELNSSIEGFESVKTEFSQYKSLQAIKGTALSHLTESGANWSKDPYRRSLQMKALDTALQSNPHKVNTDGTIIILDVDGQNPLHNNTTGENWTFKDWVQSKSPVDFVAPTTKEDKNTFTPPDGKGKGAKTFNYSEAATKAFTADDYKRKYDAGDFEEAEFIQKQMYKNLEEGK